MNQLQEIIASLRESGSKERSESSKTMYPTKMEVLGVKNPELKKVNNELYKIIKDEDRSYFISLSYDLIKTNIIECQMLTWYLLDKAKIIPSLTKDEMHMIEGVLDNWVSVDTFGVMVFGVLWREGVIPDDEVYALQYFENVWYRRLALVATVSLNLRSRGGTGDVARTISVCTRAVEDHDDMVVKALSWALRSLIIWDRDAVATFLEKHEEKLHSRVRREVRHKLEHGTKN